MDDDIRSYIERLNERARQFGLARDEQQHKAVAAELAMFANVPEPYSSAAVVTTATMALRCARRRNHRINIGDQVAFVPGLGWTCEVCAT